MAHPLIERLRNRLEGTARIAGGDICRDGRELTDTPFPPSSKPGTPPHLRTARLSNGFSSSITTSGNLILLTIENAMFYYKYVNGRTSKDPVKAALLAKWVPALKSRIRQHGATVR